MEKNIRKNVLIIEMIHLTQKKKIKETIYKYEAKIVKLAAPQCPQNHEINLTVEPPEAVLRRCSVKYCS